MMILNSFETLEMALEILRDVPLGQAVLILPLWWTHLQEKLRKFGLIKGHNLLGCFNGLEAVDKSW